MSASVFEQNSPTTQTQSGIVPKPAELSAYNRLLRRNLEGWKSQNLEQIILILDAATIQFQHVDNQFYALSTEEHWILHCAIWWAEKRAWGRKAERERQTQSHWLVRIARRWTKHRACPIRTIHQIQLEQLRSLIELSQKINYADELDEVALNNLSDAIKYLREKTARGSQ